MAPNEPQKQAIRTLQQALDKAGIVWCLCGSIALMLHGYDDRTTDDIDTYIGASSAQLIHAFANVKTVTVTSNNDVGMVKLRYVGPGSREGVPIDCFCINMTGIEYASISGYNLAPPVALPFQLFKSKVHSLSTRGFDKDKRDMIWVLDSLKPYLQIREKEIDKTKVGEILLRFPSLEQKFAQLGINLQECRERAVAQRAHAPNATIEEELRRLNVVGRIVEGHRYGLPRVQQSIPRSSLHINQRAWTPSAASSRPGSSATGAGAQQPNAGYASVTARQGVRRNDNDDDNEDDGESDDGDSDESEGEESDSDPAQRLVDWYRARSPQEAAAVQLHLRGVAQRDPNLYNNFLRRLGNSRR